ncbi:MAG: HAD-IIA family hydrolase [bacterium]
MKRPHETSAYLVDIEGVLVRDKRYAPIDGSVAWFNGLPDRGIRACLVSNNTTHRPEELLADLATAGFEVSDDRLVSSLTLGMDLLERWGKKRILWLGQPRLADYWRENGFTLVDEGSCDAVVLGANPDLQVADLDRALPALLEKRTELVALHRNLFYLDETGQRRLGPGTWCAALEAVAGGDTAVCVGKPAERIYREALKRVGAAASEALFISDDPVADLVTAKRLGMVTVFVLSGKYPDHAVLGRLDQEDWPQVICERPADLLAEKS